MNNLNENPKSWYSYNLLNFIVCFVFLPLGLLAFWKNGVKFPTYFFSVIIAGLFSLAIYQEIQPKEPIEPTISGLHPLSFSSLLMVMEENGYLVESDMNTNMEWFASMTNEENKFGMFVYPMGAGEIERIEVTAINESGNLEEIQNILEQIVSFSYDTAQPELAKEWLNENIDKTQAESVFGDAKFFMSHSENTVQLIILGNN